MNTTSNATIDVVVVYDNPLASQLSARLLKPETDIRVAAVCLNLNETLDAIRRVQPGVIVFELAGSYPTGSALLRNIGLEHPELRAVVVSRHPDEVDVFRWTGAALAAAVMGLPLAVRAMRQAIDSVDRQLEDAAATLGASRAWVFATVTLPLIVPGILNGALLAFARSLGEFGATITFVSSIPGETQTLPLAIYGFTQVPGGDEQAWRLCAVAVALSLGALMLSEWLLRAARRKVQA